MIFCKAEAVGTVEGSLACKAEAVGTVERCLACEADAVGTVERCLACEADAVGTVERCLACEADAVGTVERCLACEADAVGTAKRWKKAKRLMREWAYRRKSPIADRTRNARNARNALRLTPPAATRSASSRGRGKAALHSQRSTAARLQNENITLVSTYGALFTFRFSWMR
jgi:hypothetical protein